MDFDKIENLNNNDIIELFESTTLEISKYNECGIGTSTLYGAECWTNCHDYGSTLCRSGYACDVGVIYSNCRHYSCTFTSSSLCGDFGLTTSNRNG